MIVVDEQYENFEKNNFLSQQRWYWKSEFYSHDNMYVISDKSPPPSMAAKIIYAVSYKSIRQVIFGSKVLPACITIQRVFRGYQTRMMMDSQRVIKSAWRKHKYAKHKSARTIQKIFRGHYSRTNLVHKVYHPYNYNGKWEKLPKRGGRKKSEKQSVVIKPLQGVSFRHQ